MNELKNVGKVLAANPILVLFLGVCPALGATADLRAALAMSAAVLAVLLLSWLLYAVLSPLIPENTRLAAIVLIAAGFAAAVQLVMKAVLPGLADMLGVYLAVIAVDLLVFRQTERKSLSGSLLTGLCFALMILAVAFLRELFGAASLAGKAVPALAEYKIPLLVTAPGGFLVLSIVAAVVNKIFQAKPAEKKEENAA